MMELVEDYFPFGALKEVETSDLEEHRLRPNISSMLLTNRYVDRMGATSHIRLMEETGRARRDRCPHLVRRVTDRPMPRICTSGCASRTPGCGAGRRTSATSPWPTP